MGVIRLKKLWENGQYVADCNREELFECTDLKDAKQAWLVRGGDCDVAFEPYLTIVNPNDANALIGVQIETRSGDLFLADVADGLPEAIATACDTCCVDGTTVTEAPLVVGEYNGVIPPYTPAAAVTFCITATDNGGPSATAALFQLYYGSYDTLAVFSHTGTTTKYQGTADKLPVPRPGSTVATGACS